VASGRPTTDRARDSLREGCLDAGPASDQKWIAKGWDPPFVPSRSSILRRRRRRFSRTLDCRVRRTVSENAAKNGDRCRTSWMRRLKNGVRLEFGRAIWTADPFATSISMRIGRFYFVKGTGANLLKALALGSWAYTFISALWHHEKRANFRSRRRYLPLFLEFPRETHRDRYRYNR